MDERALDTLNEAYFSDDPHERDVIEHLGGLLHDRTLILDAGASLGQYTKAISHAVTGCEIHAVEADPSRFAVLERNCAAWAEETGNIIVAHHGALTDWSARDIGEVKFYVTNSDISGGVAPHQTARDVDWQEVSVPALCIDDLLGHRNPDFMKLDVEGAEVAALRGANFVLDYPNAGTVLVEVHEWADADVTVSDLMRWHGYREARFFGQPIFTKNRQDWLRFKAASARRRLSRQWRISQ